MTDFCLKINLNKFIFDDVCLSLDKMRHIIQMNTYMTIFIYIYGIPDYNIDIKLS